MLLFIILLSIAAVYNDNSQMPNSDHVQSYSLFLLTKYCAIDYDGDTYYINRDFIKILCRQKCCNWH